MLMRRYINFNQGDIVLIEGREHTFACCLPSDRGKRDEPDLYQFLDGRTLRATVLEQQELDDLYVKGQIKVRRDYERPADRAPDENSPDAIKRRIRQHYLHAYDAAPVPLSDRKLKAFIAQAKEELPCPCDWTPGAGTVRRWIRERGEHGDRRLRFMGDRYQAGARSSRLHRVAQEVLAEKAEAFWADRRVTSTDVWVEVVAELTKRNRELTTNMIPAPSHTTVWRYLNKHMNYERACGRLGTRKAQQLYKPIKGSLAPERILDVAEFDHTELDCWVLDDDNGIPVGRPYLAVLMDVRSRYPLAFHLSFTPPSLLSVHACLRQAIRPKEWINERFPNINGKWVAYGTPRTILVDNALESAGSSFVDACEDAGISVDWAPVRTPEYKGAIERFFGTINSQLIHKLKGSVPYKPQQMKEAGIDPEAETVLFLSDLEELIYQYFIEVYGRAVHRTLKASPEQVWRQREKIDGIDYASDLASLDASFGALVRDRTLSREGVNHNGLNYRSDAVHQLLSDLIPLEKKRGRVLGTVRVKFKISPEDVSKIWIWNEARKTYVELPCTDQKYATGLTEHHHKVLSVWAKKQNLEFQTEEQRCLAKSRLTERIQSFVPQRIRDRRRLQRLKIRVLPSDTVVMRAVDSLLAADPSRRRSCEVPIDTVSNRDDGRNIEKTALRGGSRRPRSRREQATAPVHTVAAPPLAAKVDEASDQTVDVVALLAQARLVGSS